MNTKKRNIILLIIIAIAIFMRFYKFIEFYNFSHDQDLASWIIKDILINKHLRLIGQETSSQGIFIGGLYYYLQIPFYLVGKMNPLPSIFLSGFLGIFAVYSTFFVVSKITNSEKTGLIASLIYGVSALIVFTDREVAPTMPVMLWSIWYLYSLYLIYKGKQTKGMVLWGILVGLIWHLNLALLILLPLVILPFLFSKKKVQIKAVLVGLGLALLFNLPFFVFEVRHNFSQTESIFLSLTTEKDLIEKTTTGLDKFDRVMQLVNTNSINLFSKIHFVRPSIVFWSMVISFLFLVKKKKINNFFAVLFFSWQFLYILFFTVNSLNVSEYYFNGMNIVWIAVVSMGAHELYKSKKFKKILSVLMGLFLLVNIYTVLDHNPDRKGYVEKITLVRKINEDRKNHNYPCVSISYITSPGYDLGYRYLFWLEDMHVNKPKSNSPVYSIVYPLSIVDRVDETFGSLGLIYPDYSSYNEEDVALSCSGANANLTDPMFGYTE